MTCTFIRDNDLATLGSASHNSHLAASAGSSTEHDTPCTRFAYRSSNPEPFLLTLSKTKENKMFAKTTLIGRVGVVKVRDKYAYFSLAVRFPRSDKTHWFPIYCLDPHKLSLIQQHVEKGRLLHIETRPQTRTYEQDGVNHTSFEFILQAITFLPRNTKSGGAAESNHAAPSETGDDHLGESSLPAHADMPDPEWPDLDPA